MKNNLDVVKIDKGNYGVVNFNNMIPVTPNNYELGKRRPLDARQLVNSVDDLTLESTWTKCKNNDGSLFNNAYNGMIVAVAEDASLYVLKEENCNA